MENETLENTHYENGVVMVERNGLMGTKDGLIPVKYKNLHLVLNTNFYTEKNQEEMEDFALVSLCIVEKNVSHRLDLAEAYDKIPPKTIPLKFFTFNGNDDKMGAIVVTKGKKRKHIRKQIFSDFYEGVSFKANVTKKIVIPAYFDDITFIKYLSVIKLEDEEIPEFLLKVEINEKEGIWLPMSRKFLVPPIFDKNGLDLTKLTLENIQNDLFYGYVNGEYMMYSKGSLKKLVDVPFSYPLETKQALQSFVKKARVRRRKRS